MVINDLSADLISAKNLLITMDKVKIKPKSFFWFFHNNSWRLIISSDEFKNNSSKDNYLSFINNFKNDKNLRQIGLENVTLVDPNDELIKILRSAIKTDSDSISEIRFKSNVINNFYIEDAIIYRLT